MVIGREWRRSGRLGSGEGDFRQVGMAWAPGIVGRDFELGASFGETEGSELDGRKLRARAAAVGVSVAGAFRRASQWTVRSPKEARIGQNGQSPPANFGCLPS